MRFAILYFFGSRDAQLTEPCSANNNQYNILYDIRYFFHLILLLKSKVFICANSKKHIAQSQKALLGLRKQKTREQLTASEKNFDF